METKKEKNNFLAGVPAIMVALELGKIECRAYRRDKFHATVLKPGKAESGGQARARRARAGPCLTSRACRLLKQSRATQRRVAFVPTDEPKLVARMRALVNDYGRYSDCQVGALLRTEGVIVNHKRASRL